MSTKTDDRSDPHMQTEFAMDGYFGEGPLYSCNGLVSPDHCRYIHGKQQVYLHVPL